MYSNMSNSEIALKLAELNNTVLSYDRDKTLGELFERQVEATPENTALIFENETITYRELNNKVNKLAWRLRDIGIKRGDLVAVMLNRSIEMIVAILGVLKSGAAYIPIDPNYPDERVQYMLSESETSLVLSSEYILKKLSYDGMTLKIDDAGILEQKDTNLPVISKPDDLAYVIFTSGSTGKPKGVMIEQQSVNNFYSGITKLIDFNPSKKILGLTTISFDIFALETFLPLFTGAQIVLANEQQQIDSNLLNELIIRHKIDMIQITPSRLQILLSHPKSQKSLAFVKEIMVGGEAFVKSLLPELQKFPLLRIFNMYGPTETTVWSTVKELTNEEKITIGKPIANTQIYILGEDNLPVGEGETGELCIAGDGLARGYLNAPDKTFEKFMDHPLEKGLKIYKTGDIAKLLPDGEIDIMGRNDSQVKIRGYRIELKEIEEVLSKHEKINNCAVMVLDGKNEYKYLAAYYSAPHVLEKSEIREYLLLYLPVYMIPSTFVYMEEFPLTPNGKLDRKALPLPEIRYVDLNEENSIAAVSGTEVQQEILKIWMGLLPTGNIGINDNFFDIGGNSFQLVMMSNMLNELYPDCVEVADIFANPTIAHLADFINRRNKKDGDMLNFELPTIEFPASYIQDVYEEKAVLCLGLSSEKVKYINEIADNFGLTKELMFIAIFVFIISQITERKTFSVSSVLSKEDIVRNITVDFSEIEDLAEVLIQIKEINDNSINDAGCHFDSVRAVSDMSIKKIGTVLLATRNIRSQNLEDVFDVVFKIDNQPDKFNILLEFNASVYKQSKMGELLNHYLELIEMLIGNDEK